MAVVQIEKGKVVATFRDVANAAEAREKYPHLARAVLIGGDHAPGTEWDGTRFTAPVLTPAPREESAVILALRDLADELGPVARAKLEGRLGPRRG